MAAGLIASGDLTSINTNTSIYQVPSGKTASVSIQLCNRGSANVKVRLAITNTGSITNQHYLEFDATILPNEGLLRPGIVLGSGDQVFARTDTATVNCVIYGFEE